MIALQIDWLGPIENFFGNMTSSLPNVIGALVILFIGYLVAKGISKLVYKLLTKTSWDERLLGNSVGSMNPNRFISKIVYYLLMIMVLMMVLERLGISDVLDPLKNMVAEFFAYIPNIIGAGIVFFVGYILAKFLSEAIGLGGGLADNLATKVGFNDTEKFTNILKKIVFFFVITMLAIPALDILNIDAISTPAKGILESILSAVPNIIFAVIIITLFAYGAKFLSGMVKDLLKSIGTDDLASKLELSSMMGGNSLSDIISKVLYFFVMFIGVNTAVAKLNMPEISNVLNTIITLGGQILFGLVLLIIGNFISKLVYNAMASSGDNKFLASVVRVATLGLFLAISLRAMGIANDIVELAFGLILGAVAVAVALAYGLGGREAAGEHMKKILNKF